MTHTPCTCARILCARSTLACAHVGAGSSHQARENNIQRPGKRYPQTAWMTPQGATQWQDVWGWSHGVSSTTGAAHVGSSGYSQKAAVQLGSPSDLRPH